MILKSKLRYIATRWYCGLMLPVWWAATIVNWGRRDAPHGILLLTALVIPVMLMANNLLAFRFDYSVFGRFEATLPPAQEPIARDIPLGLGGRVGLLSLTWPFLRWSAFPSGVAFSIFGTFTGFVPFDSVSSMERTLFYGLRIRHRCVEVRSPLRLPATSVVQAILELNAEAKDERFTNRDEW